MLILRQSTSDVLRIVTGSAADIEIHTSLMVVDNSTPPVVQAPLAEAAASITTATTTAIFAASALTANYKANVKHLNIYNNHASQSCTCRIEVDDGTDTVVLANVNLLAGESLVFTQNGVWVHYDANGAVYPSVGNSASQAEMEAGTASDKFVTPQGFNWHPGACKCWGKAVGAGTSLTVNWNVASVADTGTGRLGVTIGTDFSTANYAAVTSIERVATSLAVASVDNGGNFRNASFTAGVFEIENYDDTATTHVAQDPANYYWACFGDQ